MSKKSKALKRRGEGFKLVWPSHKALHVQTVEAGSQNLFDMYIHFQEKSYHTLGIPSTPVRLGQ